MKQRSDRLLLRGLYLCLGGIIVMQVFGQKSIASSLFTLTFFLTLGLWLAKAAVRFSQRDLLAVLIAMVSCISVAVNALLTGTIVTFAYLKKWIMFCCTLLCFAVMSELRLEKEDVTFLLRGNTLLTCFLAGMYFISRPQMYLLHDRISAYLTFRFTNPNLAAVFLSAMCILECIRASAEKKRRHLLLAGILFLFVCRTQARNAQLLLVFFLGVFGIFRKAGRIPTTLAVGIALFPLVFALGYLLLVDMPTVRRIFSFLAGEGKDLDSRVRIWSFALEAFAGSPIFGAYSQISEGTGVSQMHNSHLDILASYGAPAFILTCVFLVSVLWSEETGHTAFLCRMGFASILLSGIGEAMLFSGGMGIYLYAGILRMLSNFDFREPL